MTAGARLGIQIRYHLNSEPTDGANKAEQRYVRHNLFIVLNHRLHVSTYIQVIFRPSYTSEYKRA